ncbi:MarR family winged helix-turn-helix transcriptional regulator [Arthrobacter sp. NIO-1057]|uniref:MarR family winged helix-turn-helix transcriptional regulator n=1 Tax=Arthrobacter sp. NIO-1057 TaxID=993071 RepID=UPI00071CBAF1|nr:MarR family transcriptional regulator [Arthrobacter sp. NIO-1057]KSU65766.1 MarR family transcriptional regulator [Arthrobacter sp. NIO-1057]
MEDQVFSGMFSLASSDPEGHLINPAGLKPEDLTQIDQIMQELSRMRGIERKIMRSTQRFMNLNETDMRAIRKVISSTYAGKAVTAGELARYLGISSASVTKMLDRLEAGKHVIRKPHPTDRRSQCVKVTEETHQAAREQIGRHHAQRFEVLRSFSQSEREIIIRFLSGTSQAMEASLDSASQNNESSGS